MLVPFVAARLTSHHTTQLILDTLDRPKIMLLPDALGRFQFIMILHDHSEQPLVLQAAALTFAMILFEQEAAHEFHHSSPDGRRKGIDEFIFLPSWVPTPRAEVISFLANLPCPALLFQTTVRGAISLVLLDELNGTRRDWAQKTLDNHSEGIEGLLLQVLPVPAADSKVLLEIRDESHVVTLDALRLWARRFNCPSGWNFGAPHSDAPDFVNLQIRLFSPDGRVSPPSMKKAPWQRPGW